MRKQNSKKFMLPIAFVSFVVCLYFYFDDFLFLNSSKEAARKEICLAYAMALDGGGYSDVSKVISGARWRYISIVGERDGVIVYSSPIEFPGFTTQWKLFVIRRENEMVDLYLKTADGGSVDCQAR